LPKSLLILSSQLSALSSKWPFVKKADSDANDFVWNFIMTNVMHKYLFNVSIYFCLTCFGLSFSTSSEAGVQLRQWFKSAGYGVSGRALTPYSVDLNHCRNCTPVPEDGLKESPKHVRQN
jgi:hypothetical protein